MKLGLIECGHIVQNMLLVSRRLGIRLLPMCAYDESLADELAFPKRCLSVPVACLSPLALGFESRNPSTR